MTIVSIGIPRIGSFICVLLFLVSCDRVDQTRVANRDSSVWGNQDSITRSPSDTDGPKPDPTKTDWKTYENKEYGFSFSYPPDLKVREGFEEIHQLTANWRAMAMPDQQGIAVVSVPIVRISSEDHYPRYYDVDFRIGVSSELGNACAAKNGERTLGTIVLNGSTFNQFEFSDAGMMKSVSGISYRTGHNGRCFAIEQIRNGSSYREGNSPSDLPQSTLDSSYFLAGKIVRTFKFIR